MFSKQTCMHAAVCVFSLFSLLLLGGCSGMAKFPSATDSSVQGVALRGGVHGGQQPIVQSVILLYAAGTTGYTGTSQSLLTPGSPGVISAGGINFVQTDASGSFSISGDYTCPSANSQIYVIAFGGNPGLTPGTFNSSLSFAAALGPCAGLNSNSFIHMNEVTTVAAVYALAPFVNLNFDTVATSATNTAGLANAFSTVNNLVDTPTGTARTATLAGNGMVPQAKINLLANILATCVNSTGNGSACQNLFAAATLPGSSSPPSTTAQAALNIALHPLNNAHAIWLLYQQLGAPFQPSLNTEPSDWTMSVAYPVDPANGLAAQALAIDSLGSVWLPSGSNAGVFTKLNNLGAPVAGSPFTVAGLNPSLASSIDQQDNIWFGANSGSYLYAKVSAGGVFASGFPNVRNSGFSAVGHATDASSNFFATVYYAPSNTYSLQKFTATQMAYSGNPYVGGGLTGVPLSSLAIDANGQAISLIQCQTGCTGGVTSTNQGGYAVFSNAGVAVSPSQGYLLNAANATPTHFVLDAQGNNWVSGNFGSAFLAKASQTGSMLALAPATIGAGNLAIDGLNTIWTVDQFGNLTQLDTNGNVLSIEAGVRTAYGQDITGVNGPTQIAIDSTGSLWRADYTGNAYQFVGLAAPVQTPLSKAAALNLIGQKP